jgi:molybdopterin-guanine dinucleotide biosynthesis protein A
MKKYNLIVLAGGRQEPLYEVTGVENKAQILIHGKPMLEWVLDAFTASRKIADIVVAGPRELEQLDCMKQVRKRVHGGATVLESLMNAVAYAKLRLSSGDAVHRGYLISFGDAVFLNPEVIQAMLNNIETSLPDLALHYVEKGVYERAGLPLTRTFIPMAEGLYTGTTLYYVRRFRDLSGCLPQLAQLRKVRKQPQKLLQELGCEEMSMNEIATHLSRQLDAKLKIFALDHPEAGMDVDKPVDLALAKKWLA